ncbi:lytic transglycosylase domain-containing protein [Methylobacillus sp.]|uniref:lytic transglycosylase domain-containing protein n=1 Tax=Methylobacillus sp. TaxID=56818 RepID=UPI0012CE7A5C|nr:lytic transglycosylase domain-containing protein [Methylobacillus sp.]MPS47722.1 lytic transglycosylase domain-containing protein [Methylobacillus sp.]
MSKLGLIFILAFWTWLSLIPESRADICLQGDSDDVMRISNTGNTQDCTWRISEAIPLQRATASATMPFHDAVTAAAHATQLDPALLHAVIKTESGYQASAVSPRGATGLMQLMPATARQLGVSNALDPGQNIMAGARYLSQLQHEFNGDISLALAAYNAGPATVKRYGNVIPPYAETRAYVPKVLQAYRLISGKTD